MKPKSVILVILIILNCMVLLGKLWSKGVPAFAGAVTIILLISSLLFFVMSLVKEKKITQRQQHLYIYHFN